MSEMRSEFLFGFVGSKGNFPGLPMEFGTFVCETVFFDFTTFKAKTVEKHEVINLNPQSKNFYADSWLATTPNEAFSTLTDWKNVNMRKTYSDP